MNLPAVNFQTLSHSIQSWNLQNHTVGTKCSKNPRKEKKDKALRLRVRGRKRRAEKVQKVGRNYPAPVGANPEKHEPAKFLAGA